MDDEGHYVGTTADQEVARQVNTALRQLRTKVLGLPVQRRSTRDVALIERSSVIALIDEAHDA